MIARSNISILKYADELNWKTCPTRLSRAQSALLCPELPQVVLKASSCHSTGFSLCRADGKCPICLVVANNLGKCQLVVDSIYIYIYIYICIMEYYSAIKMRKSCATDSDWTELANESIQTDYHLQGCWLQLVSNTSGFFCLFVLM